jgi:hypothetical protein
MKCAAEIEKQIPLLDNGAISKFPEQRKNA